MSTGTRTRTDPPDGQSPYVLGPLAFGASIGLQIMMAAFLRFGPTRGQPFAMQLTPYGRKVSAPEYDLPIFVGGVALTLVGSLAAAAWWARDVDRTASTERAERMRVSSLLLGGLGLASLAATLGLACSYWFSHDVLTDKLPTANPWRPLDCYRLLLPAAMALSCAIWDLGPRGNAALRIPQGGRSGFLRRFAVAAFALLVVLVIGIAPARWTDLAGTFFAVDRCHHLNYFVVGPALSFAHGRAFGTEIYSQYGIGWPWLLSALSPFFSIGSYGASVGMAVVFACLYSLAWLFTLWLCFRSFLWAAIAVVLAIIWQLFTGVGGGEVIWQFPSATMMRHPFDVAFFLALVLHQRSGRLPWTAVAGLAAALGVFFETETGIYLLVAFGLYWLLQFANARGGRRTADSRGSFAVLGAFYLTAAIGLLPLLFYASRGTLFSSEFFSGWLEPLFRYSALGMGAIPLAIVPDAALVLFVAMVATYVGAIGYGAHRSLHGHAKDEDALLATISAYGLALLLLFASRSHPFNLWHAAVPFAIAVTMLLHRGEPLLRSRLPHSSIPHVLCIGLIALLLSNAAFRTYPSLLASWFRAAPAPGLALLSDPVDLTGFPDQVAPLIEKVANIAAAIHEIAPDGDGDDIAVFDADDTLLYLAADVAPWSRYASLFTMAVTHRSLDQLRAELAERPPRYIVLRKKPDPVGFAFLWSSIHDFAQSRYVLSRTVEEFEFWQLPDGSRER